MNFAYWKGMDKVEKVVAGAVAITSVAVLISIVALFTHLSCPPNANENNNNANENNNSSVVLLESKEHLETLLKENGEVVLMIGANWCPHCGIQKPIFEETSSRVRANRPGVAFVYFNVDNKKGEDVRAMFHRTYVPSFHWFRNSKWSEIKTITELVSLLTSSNSTS